MPDLRARFRTFDHIATPDAWSDVEARGLVAAPVQPTTRWLVLVAAAGAAAIIGGAVVFGSGIVPTPGPSETPGPTSTQDASPPASPSMLPGPNDPSAWTATGDMHRSPGETVTLTRLPDDRVVAIGGDYGSAPPELLDPATGTWAVTTDGEIDRWYHTATLLPDGRVLVVGGWQALAGAMESLSSAELFDPVSGVWTATGSLHEARGMHVAIGLADGRVLVFGGQVSVSDGGGASHGEPVRSAELYDPTTGTWSVIEGPPGEPGTATRLLDGRVLVVGDPYLFDPNTESWTPTSEPVSGHGVHTATLLLDGRVLIAGGGDCCEWSTFAEIYDPAADSWAVTGQMTAPRGYFTATLLPDGRVLAAGGGDGGTGGFPTAELYDPATGTWTATANMLASRGWHEAIGLSDGRVLVVGGSGQNADNPGAEIYDSDGGG
jgi:hypothetical protein